MGGGEEGRIGGAVHIEGDIHIHRTAVAVVNQVANLLIRVIQGIGAVEEELDFPDSAKHQNVVDFGTHMAPDAHGAGQLILRIAAIDQQPRQAAAGGHPGAADIEGKANQCVILRIGKRDGICIEEGIELLLHLGNDIDDELVCFLPGDGSGGKAVLLGVFRGAAVANGILGYIHIGRTDEALQILNHLHPVVGGAQLIFGGILVDDNIIVRLLVARHMAVQEILILSSQCRHAGQTEDHHQRQKQAQKAEFHGRTPFRE